jgi:hypothetical protein
LSERWDGDGDGANVCSWAKVLIALLSYLLQGFKPDDVVKEVFEKTIKEKISIFKFHL